MNMHSLRVLARVVAAVFVAYAVTAACVAVVSLALPWAGLASRAQAVQGATLFSFLLYLVLVLWAFAARGVRKVWIGMAVILVVMGVLWWVLWALSGTSP